MSRGGPRPHGGGVPCPACGTPAQFRRFAERGECPSCGTALRELFDRADATDAPERREP